jgi:hypothetical protein
LNAQAEQANKHNEKQDDISSEGTDGAKFDTNLGVAWQAGIRCRIPRSELEMDAVDLDGQRHMKLSFTSHMANAEPRLFGIPGQRVKGLTMYEECNVSQPYADCNRHHNLPLVPNGNAADTYYRWPYLDG